MEVNDLASSLFSSCFNSCFVCFICFIYALTCLCSLGLLYFFMLSMLGCQILVSTCLVFMLSRLGFKACMRVHACYMHACIPYIWAHILVPRNPNLSLVASISLFYLCNMPLLWVYIHAYKSLLPCFALFAYFFDTS